jgi:tRNA threonylcarbamoyl adenosine modification protein YeaZ
VLVLGIDTSGRYAGLALVKGEHLLAENSWECRQSHSVTLMPALEELLAKTGLRARDLEGIGVATGPGSFNGLRVGMSIAKGLAYSLDIPICAVPTLEAIALRYAVPGMIIAPVIKSGPTLLATAFYKTDNKALIEIKAPFLAKIEDIAKAAKRKTLFCGDVDPGTQEALTSFIGSKAAFPLFREFPVYSTVIALRAADKIHAGETGNVQTLEPFYLKKPHITKPKNKAALTRTSPRPSKAVIWDMDGVIVNSASYHLRSWQEAFRPTGITFEDGYFWKTFGVSNADIVTGLNLSLNQNEIQALIKTKESIFRQMVSQGIEPLPGAIDLIIELKKRKISMAIASSAPLANIKCTLNTLGIRQYFRAVIGEEDVTRGKPDPEVFLKAAEKLGVMPQKCVVVEDALQGIRAAKRAGMACIAVAGTYPAEALKEAELVISSLADIDTEELLGLIK